MEQCQVGVVKELFRYPVKSMQGERLSAVDIGAHGVIGDRAYALREANGRVVTAKKWPNSLVFCARYDAPPTPGALAPLCITLPDGQTIQAQTPDASAVLSAVLGRPVMLDRAQSDQPSHAEIDSATVFGDVPIEHVLPERTAATMPDSFALPPGTFFDSGHIHVLASGTLAHLRTSISAGTQLDPHRFRPNIVVETAPGEEGFLEDDWLEGTLKAGESVRIVQMRPTLRCVMTTHRQADLVRDLRILRTAELADVVLPAASAFEREALKIGFEISQEAQSLIQLRPAVVPPPGEARPDTDIIFDLAARLGLAAQFWQGDIEAAYRHQLASTGVTLEQLRATPGGVRIPLQTRHAKHAELEAHGAPRGFATPSRKVELYSQTFLEYGYAPLPEFAEPPSSPVAKPDLAARFPLILTSAKSALFCQTQHHALPSLRKRALHPEVELHPTAAQARGIANSDWVSIETPEGSVRARARLNDQLDPRVAVGAHGWWQACAEIGAPGYDPFGPMGANCNLLVDTTALDPVSGTASHRAYLCEIRPVAPEKVSGTMSP